MVILLLFIIGWPALPIHEVLLVVALFAHPDRVVLPILVFALHLGFCTVPLGVARMRGQLLVVGVIALTFQ